MIFPGRMARILCGAVRNGVIATALLAEASAGGAVAQTPATDPAAPPAATSSPVGRQQQPDQERLNAVQDEQRKSLEAQKRLMSENSAISDEQRRLKQSLVDSAHKIRTTEERIAAMEGHLHEFDTTEVNIRKSLDGRRSQIAEILAALQRIGRHTPPAVLIGPHDAAESLRAVMSFEAVLPEMRAEANKLQAELTELANVKAAKETEHNQLTAELSDLAGEQKKMEELLEERRMKQAQLEQSIAKERERTSMLSRQVDNLKDLLAKLPAKSQKPTLSALNDTSKMGPAVTFVSAKGKLSLPVNGTKIKDYGTPDVAGNNEKGISISTRAGAQVTAPCDGWVVYAAPFRSYGQLLILNVGGGYHVLLAGMDRITVDPGQFVLTGEPVATMGTGVPGDSTPSSGSSPVIGPAQPVLYIEFRKDGTPIDSTPWWAATVNEKVGG